MRKLPTAASFLNTEDCNLRCVYCVTGDTEITMEDFSKKKIVDIVKGDMILGFDEFASKKGKHRKVYPAEVLQLHSREDEVIEITLDCGDVLTVSKNHRLLNISNPLSEWLEAGNYSIDDELVILTNNELTSSKIVKIKELGMKDVYNIGTDSRTYIANNFAVHNCFESHNKSVMTVETARKGIDFLVKNAVSNGDDSISTMIFGGEPFLVPDVVETILSYGLKQTKKHNLMFFNSVVTNGTILTERLKRIISKYRDSCNITIQLSVDGVKESHDMYRIDKAGNGSFDRIEKNLEGFKELFKTKPDGLSVHGCVNKLTLKYLYESFIFFRTKWNVGRIWFMPVHTEDWGPEDVKLYDSELGKIYDYILQEVKNTNSLLEVEYYAPIDHCLRPNQRASKPCGAGDNFVTFTANGDIYPCHQLYFNDPDHHTKIGSLDEGLYEAKRDIFVFYDNTDMSCHAKDPDCEATACYRCIGDNYDANGSLFSQIQGYRCGLSKVEAKYQNMMRKEIAEMGLMNAQRGEYRDPSQSCDLVSGCNGVAREELEKYPEKYRIAPINYGKNSHNNTSNNNSCGCGDNHGDNTLEDIKQILMGLVDNAISVEETTEKRYIEELKFRNDMLSAMMQMNIQIMNLMNEKK